jgi:hypothetical protein
MFTCENNRPVLTEKEKKISYSKYFYREDTPINDEVKEIIDNKIMMNPEDVILGDRINDMIEPEKIKVENGYCILPNGCGYVAAYHKMPGVTLEMYKWWNSWWTSGEESNLKYKIWCPKHHYDSGFKWNLETCGTDFPLEDVYIQDLFREVPERMGIDIEKMKKSKLVMVDGANATSRVLNGDYSVRPIPTVVAHFIYETEDGIEMRTRFWKGYQVLGNRFIPVLKSDDIVSEESLLGLLEHNVLEMDGGLKVILPQLYREECLEKKTEI